MKVLVADNDSMSLDVTAFALHRHGYDVVTASNGLQAVRRWESEQPDVAVLEAGLPQIDGLEVCRRIRREKDTAIIVVGSSQDDDAVEKAFVVGADDYLTKPFSHRQLALRIQAISRRKPSASEEPHRDGRLTVANLVMDLQSHQVSRGEVTTRLTPIEFRILYMLAVNEGHAVPSARLADYAWDYNGGDPSLLKIHVYQIRRKLQMSRGEAGIIRSIPWVGYMLSASTDDKTGSEE